MPVGCDKRAALACHIPADGKQLYKGFVKMAHIERQDERRHGLSVIFPLTDHQGKSVARNRRRLADRRLAQYDQTPLKILPTLYKLAFDLFDGVRIKLGR